MLQSIWKIPERIIYKYFEHWKGVSEKNFILDFTKTHSKVQANQDITEWRLIFSINTRNYEIWTYDEMLNFLK